MSQMPVSVQKIPQGGVSGDHIQAFSCRPGRRNPTGHPFPPRQQYPSGAGTLAQMTSASSEGGLRVNRHLLIPEAELSWRFSASGGPGGQHANTSNTRVELVFEVSTSEALGPRQRARLMERLGSQVRVVVSEERSQARNREIALGRLAGRIEEALRVQRPRHATAPTKASRERRLHAKRLLSERKVGRRAPPPDEGH
jgi:ribosome-associated protein